MNLKETEKSKSKKFKKATIKNRLKKIFANTPENVQKTVEGLIDNAAFMADNLEDLQTEIEKAGWIEKYQNGANQKGTKISTAGQAYNALIKNYNAVIKNLFSYLPEEKKNEFDDFMNHTGFAKK